MNAGGEASRRPLSFRLHAVASETHKSMQFLAFRHSPS